MQPIGTVHHDVPDEQVPRRRRDIVAEVHIAARYAPALAGIEAYSQLIVLFWMHRAATEDPALLVHPRGDRSLPLTGALATRGRARPNPIGLAVVDLLGRRDNVLTVRRLDAWSGTPVIDVKPYDHYDVCPDPRVPQWLQRRQR